MNRSDLRTFCWDLLGVKPSDPFFTSLRLDTALNTAEGRLSEEVRRQAPDMFRMKKTLVPDGGAGRVYTFSTQAAPLIDFHEVLSLRYGTATGQQLRKVNDGDLESFSGGYYSIIGTDLNGVIEIDAGLAAATNLFLKYSRKTAAWPDPANSPESVPVDFHDVIGLNAVELLFALGGESKMPAEFAKWAMDRRGAFWTHVGRRSGDPSRAPSDQQPAG